MKRILLDMDPGLDDMVALLLAFGHPSLSIEGLVATYGNIGLDHTLPNALHLVSYLGKTTPVYRGSLRPLVREPITGGHIHGSDGMAGFPFPETTETDKGDGIVFLRERTRRQPGPCTVVATGPLTDIATVLREDPSWKDSVEELVVMGGGLAGGNATDWAEFNILSDPEAARTVFSSGIRLTLFPLDVTTQVVLDRALLDRLEKPGGHARRLFGSCMEYYFRTVTQVLRECPAMHDPCTIAYLLQPDLFTIVPKRLDVCTDQGSAHYGQTFETPQGHPVSVAVRADAARFWPLLSEALDKLG